MAQVSGKDTTKKLDLGTESKNTDETSVDLESELGLENVPVTEGSLESEDSGLGLRFETSCDRLNAAASCSGDGFSIEEDFDSLPQYGTDRAESTDHKPDSSTPSDHNHLALETAWSEQNPHPESSQSKRMPSNFLTGTEYGNNFAGEGAQMEFGGDSPSPGPLFASCDLTNDLSGHHGESLLEDGGVVEIQDDDDIASEDVDSDNFVSKEVSDLLHELRKEAMMKETSHPASVKGIARISEIDSFIEDGLQFDFVEDFLEAEQSSQLTTIM